MASRDARSQSGESSVLPPWGLGVPQVRLMKDQLIMARAYASIAVQSGNTKLGKELKARIKDSSKALGEAERDTDLARK